MAETGHPRGGPGPYKADTKANKSLARGGQHAKEEVEVERGRTGSGAV